MKTYRGSELVKAAKYLCQLGANRRVIETVFKIESVDVEDRKAVVHYTGEIEQATVKLDVTVYKATTYPNEYVVTLDDNQYTDSDYSRVDVWMHSINKLDSDEAKTGKIRLLPDQWKRVHRSLLNKFAKDFNLSSARRTNFEQFVEFRYLGYGSFGAIREEIGLVLLEYDRSIKDFKKHFDNYALNIHIGISNDVNTLAIGYSVDSRSYLADVFKAILPMAKPGSSSILYRSDYYIEGSYDEILEICRSARDRLFMYYDHIIASSGGNANWRSAIDWTESGPVYPENTKESQVAKEMNEAKVSAAKEASISRVANLCWSIFDADITKVFSDSTIECNTFEYCDDISINVPYKFPKVKGSKAVLVDKVLIINIHRDDYPWRWRSSGRYNEIAVTYQLPGLYDTMQGEYCSFSEAVRHDSERMMRLKPSKRKYRVFYSEQDSSRLPEPVFDVIKTRIAELSDYVQYKGFSVRGMND